MLNLEDFVKRLELVMDFYGLSGGSFADKIGIQRSSLSHLLSGRNKPSLDFVMKIVSVLPDVDLEWILNGTGIFPKSNQKIMSTTVETKPAVAPILLFPDDNEVVEIKKTTVPSPVEETTALQKQLETDKIDEKSNVTIDHIVIFYSDGTFSDYKKNKSR